MCVFTFINRIVKISIVPPPANPNPPLLFSYEVSLMARFLKSSPALSSVSSGQIGSILLKALHSPRSAAVTHGKAAGGEYIVPTRAGVRIFFFFKRSVCF